MPSSATSSAAPSRSSVANSGARRHKRSFSDDRVSDAVYEAEVALSRLCHGDSEVGGGAPHLVHAGSSGGASCIGGIFAASLFNVVEEEERAYEREFNTLGSCVPNATAAGMASFNAEDETEVARQLPGRRLSSPAQFSSWAGGVCFVGWCDGTTERCTAPRCTRVWHSVCYTAGCEDNEAMMPGCCGPCAGGSSWLAVDQ